VIDVLVQVIFELGAWSSSAVVLSVELLPPSKEVSLEVFTSIIICFPQRAHKYI